MHDTTARVLGRLDRFVVERLAPQVYRSRTPLRVTSWDAPGEPVPFADARDNEFVPLERGTPWGRAWGTTWFRLLGELPEAVDGAAVDTANLEVVVDLGFSTAQPGFQAEATAYDGQGRVLKGIHPRNRFVPVRQVIVGEEPAGGIELFLEASANPAVMGGGPYPFAPTALGDPDTAGDKPLYRFLAADLAERDVEVAELLADVTALRGLVDELPEASSRRAEVVAALADAMTALDPHDVPSSASRGRAALADVLSRPAHSSAHQVVAVGHAHIDSAWLWPTRETVRKCARTFAGVLSLMETDDDLVFACSSAQQYDWVRDAHPELFARIRQRVAEGRFVPVGGMWVESDTNLPGGEALARQFVAGQRFFVEELGVQPTEVWLPDSFGYSAALPQLARLAGLTRLLTQKPSWNDTNTMPHHTFWWEGIDGSRVFTHFPPADTYHSDVGAADLARAERQFAEKGRAVTSLLPFGYGDGGGGPTREMLAAAARTRSLEGSPAVRVATPREFFEAAEAEYDDPPVWSGEIYLELHRGTYTSQARTKRGNRRSEHLLREAELWATTAAVRAGASYPYDDLERCWQAVLLGQFHDILPGSSIAWVHREAEAGYARVAEELESVIGTALGSLAGEGSQEVVFNAGPFARAGVPALAADPASYDTGGHRDTDQPSVRARAVGHDLELDNGRVRVVVDRDGLLSSVRDLAADREVLSPGTRGALLQLHRDTPTRWDAWDVDALDRTQPEDLVAADSVELVGGGLQRAVVRVVRTFGASRVEQLLSLEAGSAVVEVELRLDWHERQRLLKLAFPLDVHADRAASETQFGHVFRPTHTNTSWEAARFETCAHRWVHVGEPGYGVAVANDSTYGHDVGRTARPEGGTTTTVRLSLLRAPLYPDPDADQGEHVLRASLVVGAGIAEAIEEGYRLNLPLRRVTGGSPVAPLVTVEPDPEQPAGAAGGGAIAVVVEAVKLAEDRSGDVVVRLYESFGGRARVRLRLGFAAETVSETDLLEHPVEPQALGRFELDASGGTVALAVHPFQVVTLRLRPRP